MRSAIVWSDNVWFNGFRNSKVALTFLCKFEAEEGTRLPIEREKRFNTHQRTLHWIVLRKILSQDFFSSFKKVRKRCQRHLEWKVRSRQNETKVSEPRIFIKPTNTRCARDRRCVTHVFQVLLKRKRQVMKFNLKKWQRAKLGWTE